MSTKAKAVLYVIISAVLPLILGGGVFCLLNLLDKSFFSEESNYLCEWVSVSVFLITLSISVYFTAKHLINEVFLPISHIKREIKKDRKSVV